MTFPTETAAASIRDQRAIGERDFMPQTQLVRVRRIMRVMASLAGERVVCGARRVVESCWMRVLVRHATSICPCGKSSRRVTADTSFTTCTGRRTSGSGVERIIPFGILDVIGLAVMALGAIASREGL